MPKVLFTNVFFSPDSFGGATVVVEQLAECMTGFAGYEVAAVSVMSRPEYPHYAVVKMQANGVTNYCINLPEGRSIEQRYRGSELAEPFRRVLDAVMPDVVNVHCIQELGAECMDIIAARDTPIVLSVHDFWWLCERQFMINKQGVFCGKSRIEPSLCVGCVDSMAASKRRDAYLRGQLDKAAFLTFPSDYARELYVRSGLPADRCITLKNGINFPSGNYWGLRDDRKRKQEGITFGFVGGPGFIKGWNEIKQAAKSLNNAIANFHVVNGPAGSDWWGGEHLEALPGNWQVVERYTAESMDLFFSEIDVMLFPSRWKETFGLTVREALARGVYVVVSDAGGAAEDCRDGIDSTVLPFDFKSSDLASVMEALIEQGVPQFDPPKLHSKRGQALELKSIVESVLRGSD